MGGLKLPLKKKKQKDFLVGLGMLSPRFLGVARGIFVDRSMEGCLASFLGCDDNGGWLF